MPLPKIAHNCPANGCTATVPNRLLACPKHWFELPSIVRMDIEATAGLNPLHPERRAALDAALSIWRTAAQPKG